MLDSLLADKEETLYDKDVVLSTNTEDTMDWICESWVIFKESQNYKETSNYNQISENYRKPHEERELREYNIHRL